MTTLTFKLQEVTKRLQQLTVWRPNERDPFFELDHWRIDAHTTIEQIYNKKRQQIEQIIEKHEREFMRELTRQRLLLNSIRKSLLVQKDINKLIRTQYETSILNDLQKIENDISTKLGRGEIVIETNPLNFEDSVMIGLKTYLSVTPSMYFKEMSVRNQSKKPIRRSADEVAHAFNNWLQTKNKEEAIVRKELQSARTSGQYSQENSPTKQERNEKAYNDWLNTKKTKSAFTKKKLNINDNHIKQETNAT